MHFELRCLDILQTHEIWQAKCTISREAMVCRFKTIVNEKPWFADLNPRIVIYYPRFLALTMVSRLQNNYMEGPGKAQGKPWFLVYKTMVSRLQNHGFSFTKPWFLVYKTIFFRLQKPWFLDLLCIWLAIHVTLSLLVVSSVLS